MSKFSGATEYRDLDPFTGDDSAYPAEAVKVDGSYLEDLIAEYQTLQVTGRELQGQDIHSSVIGRADGQRVAYQRRTERVLTVKYKLAADTPEAFREAFYKLNAVLGGDQHRVIIHDDETKYWNATLQDADVPDGGKLSVVGTFTLFVPDGVAHSLVPQVATNQPDGTSGTNLFSDSEFKHPKFWKTWVGFGGTGYGGSAAATLKFDPSLGDSDDEYITNDELFNSLTTNYFRATNAYLTRRKVAVKKGDVIHGSVMVNVTKAEDKVFVLNVSEYPDASSPATFFDSAAATGFTVGTWTKLSVTHTIQSNDTQYIELKPYVIAGSQVSISQPMLSVGAAAIDYVASGSGVLDTLTITNGGTYKSWPVIHALMNSDNSLVAMANSNGGALQFGDPEDVDAVDVPHIDREYRWDMTKAPAGAKANSGVMNYPYRMGDTNTANTFSGSWRFWAGPNMATPSYATTQKDQTWSGPSVSYDLAGNYEGLHTADFEYVNKYRFRADTNNMYRLETTLSNGAYPWFTVTFRSSTTTLNDFRMDVSINGAVSKSYNLNALPVKKNVYSKTNIDYYKEGTIELRMRRRGDVLTVVCTLLKEVDGKTVYSNGKKWQYSYTVEDASMVAVDGTTVWASKYAGAQPNVTYWMDSYFEWINADGQLDVPNEFAQGQELTIDTGARKVYLDGAETGLFTIGNQWERFGVDPGTSMIISPVASSFADPMTVWVEMQEAYV
ncbi:distal tail protein Dit [Lacticaseibacillus mingshuiensis]|uniref:distal tail protein Dit n=1 Tax=Lacticaseibacillus mingshuiensis TaxID=2799574 RepID=UPI00194F598A|nr:distal tail protein Dit [Lacticaseibacillus mingshuiensis]